ncbi:MAG: DUF4430 domain-containing protein [Oscillospiraceae bacterium]|nr:DUF4430 domain-containing protein [Oscillospiraceae bacterium]
MKIKKILSVVFAALICMSCFALIAYADNAAGKVYISLEDFGDRDYLLEYCDEDEMAYLEQFGVIVPKTEVPIYAGESVAEAVVRFFEMNGIKYNAYGTPELNGGFYLVDISFTSGNEYVDSFGEGSITPDDDFMRYFSGWMVKLNNCFTSSGISCYEVDDGDIIEIQYTCSMGADLGYDFSVQSAAITGIVIDESYGTISPEFSEDIKEYTLTLNDGVNSVKLAVQNENYSSVVTYSANGTEYKFMRDIPVQDGTVITVKSEYYASDYPDYVPYLFDEDEITITVVKPAIKEPEEDGDTSFLGRIKAFFAKIGNFFKNIFSRISDFFSGLFNR